jgi:multiple sugar transport system ATP-binding protein
MSELAARAACGFRQICRGGAENRVRLRPDDLYPTGQGLHSGQASAVHEREMTVNLTEPPGNETLVFPDFAGREWVSRMLNPRPLAPGALLPVSFDLSHARLFDAGSGVALAREEV